MTHVHFQKLTLAEWEAMPKPTTPTKASPYDEALQAVIDGAAVAFPFEDIKDVKGMRIGLARRASRQFNIKLDFRVDETRKLMAIRLHAESLLGAAPKGGEKPRGGRKPTAKVK